MKVPRTRFGRACDAREKWAADRGNDGWSKPGAAIAEEIMEEAVDIPVWGKGIATGPINRWQHSLLGAISLLACAAWYLADLLRRSLEP